MPTEPLEIISIPPVLNGAKEFVHHNAIWKHGGIPVPVSCADHRLCDSVFKRVTQKYLPPQERDMVSLWMAKVKVAVDKHGYSDDLPATETTKAGETSPPPKAAAAKEPKNADKDKKSIKAFLAQHAAALQDLKAQVAGLKAENANREAVVAGITTENAKLLADVEALMGMNAIRERDNNDIRAAHATLKTQVDSIKTENTALKAEVSVLNAKNAILESELDGIRVENAALNTTLDDIKAENAVLSATVDRHKTDNAVFKSAVRGLTEGNRTLQGDIEGIKTENAALKAEIEDIKTRNGALDPEIEGIKTENEGLKAELETIKHSNTALKAQLEQLKSTAEASDKSDKSFRVELDMLKDTNDWVELVEAQFKDGLEEHLATLFEQPDLDNEFFKEVMTCIDRDDFVGTFVRLGVFRWLSLVYRRRLCELSGEIVLRPQEVKELKTFMMSTKETLDAPALNEHAEEQPVSNVSGAPEPTVAATSKLDLLETKLDKVLDAVLSKQHTSPADDATPALHLPAPSEDHPSSSTAPASHTASNATPSDSTSHFAAPHPDPYFNIFSHIVNTLHGIESHLNGGRMHKTDVAALLPSIDKPVVSTTIDKQLGTTDGSDSEGGVQDVDRLEHQGMTKDKVDAVDNCLLRDVVQRLEAVEAALHRHDGLVDRVDRVEKGVVVHNDKLKVMLMRLNIQHEEIMRMRTGSDTATAAGTRGKGKGKEAEDKMGNRMDNEPIPKEDHKSNNKPAGINRDSTEFFQLPHPRLDEYKAVTFVEAVTDSEDEVEHVSRASWSSRATNGSGSEGGSDSSWLTAGRPRG